MDESIRDEIIRCGACRMCFDVCHSYQLYLDERFSPMYRLLIIRKMLDGTPPDKMARRILEGCTLCEGCDGTCTEQIPITEAIRTALEELKNPQ
jgi:glycolate oxidase iron-sulfur subunit